MQTSTEFALVVPALNQAVPSLLSDAEHVAGIARSSGWRDVQTKLGRFRPLGHRKSCLCVRVVGVNPTASNDPIAPREVWGF